MKPEYAPISWDEVSHAFSRFAGSCLYAIRADTFFHLSLRVHSPIRFVAKNLLYPLALSARSRKLERTSVSRRAGDYLFICDYAAEPGFGSLRPLLNTCPSAATVVVNAAVWAARQQELSALPGIRVLIADQAPPTYRYALWRRCQSDYRALLSGCDARLRRNLQASRLVIWRLLFRAYSYRRFFESLIAQASPIAVITHNDFTSLSYLAGDAARRAGIPDFTLQHGFPSAEYFPTTATYYMVWGTATAAYMKQNSPLSATAYIPVGAPRLDSLAWLPERQAEARRGLEEKGLRHSGKLNLLFLSQSHSPVFSPLEHKWILSLVGELAAEPDVHLMIRRHPQEVATRLRRHPGLGAATQLPASVSLIESLLASDVVISVNSTAMLEAALLRVPVVQISATRFEDRLGMLRFPRSMNSLESARLLLQGLRTPRQRDAAVAEQQAMIENHFGRPGHATQETWRYIQHVSAPERELAASRSQP